MTRWMRERRDLLKRLGLAAAWLPLLGTTRARAQGRTRTKLICVLGIEGYRQPSWRPATGALAGQTLPKAAMPLAAHRDDLLFLSGLSHTGGGGRAAYGTVFWGLPGALGDGQYKEPNGKTLDQVVADALPALGGGESSIAFGVQLDRAPRASTMPGASMCFWKGAGMPIRPEGDPGAAYRRLFGASVAGDPAALRFQRKSTFDYVGGSLRRFAERTGSEGKTAILAHLDAVRALESRLLFKPPGLRCGNPPPVIDLQAGASYPDVLRAELDVMVAALACNVTRVATLQLADASGASINFGAFVPGLPVSSPNNYKSPYRNWNDLGHNPVLDGVDHKAIVDTWWMTHFAALITRLKATPDLDGTSLFDNTVVLWANPVEDGANHNSAAMPWLVACRAGGPLRTGQHVAAGGRASSGVLAAVAKAMGVHGEPFGAAMTELVG